MSLSKLIYGCIYMYICINKTFNICISSNKKMYYKSHSTVDILKSFVGIISYFFTTHRFFTERSERLNVHPIHTQHRVDTCCKKSKFKLKCIQTLHLLWHNRKVRCRLSRTGESICSYTDAARSESGDFTVFSVDM